MIQIEHLKNINLSVDGRGYAGEVSELNPPKLSLKMEEHRGGGMDAPVEFDVGMDKLEASFGLTSSSAAVLKRWGLSGAETTLVFRAAYKEHAGGVKAAVITMTGKVKEVDRGSWKPGDKGENKFTIALSYYKEELDSETLIEIDILGMKRIIGGVDQLEAERTALGL